MKHGHVLFILFMHPVYLVVAVGILPRDDALQTLQTALTGGYGFDFLYWLFVAMVAGLVYEDVRIVAEKLSNGSDDAATE